MVIWHHQRAHLPPRPPPDPSHILQTHFRGIWSSFMDNTIDVLVLFSDTNIFFLEGMDISIVFRSLLLFTELLDHMSVLAPAHKDIHSRCLKPSYSEQIYVSNGHIWQQVMHLGWLYHHPGYLLAQLHLEHHSTPRHPAVFLSTEKLSHLYSIHGQ